MRSFSQPPFYSPYLAFFHCDQLSLPLLQPSPPTPHLESTILQPTAQFKWKFIFVLSNSCASDNAFGVEIEKGLFTYFLCIYHLIIFVVLTLSWTKLELLFYPGCFFGSSNKCWFTLRKEVLASHQPTLMHSCQSVSSEPAALSPFLHRAPFRKCVYNSVICFMPFDHVASCCSSLLISFPNQGQHGNNQLMLIMLAIGGQKKKKHNKNKNTLRIWLSVCLPGQWLNWTGCSLPKWGWTRASEKWISVRPLQTDF